MPSVNVFVVLLLLACLTWQATAPATTTTAAAAANGRDNYVKVACSVTRYPDLCIQLLAPFSNNARRSHRRWARAAVSVTLGEASSVAQYLSELKKNGSVRGRERVALSDCVECFNDTIDNVHKSLSELRSLKAETFDAQVGNVETWMSAALTYEDTCLDGFNLGTCLDGLSDRKGRRVKSLCKKVLNVTRITSNALALVDKLASAGG